MGFWIGVSTSKLQATASSLGGNFLASTIRRKKNEMLSRTN